MEIQEIAGGIMVFNIMLMLTFIAFGLIALVFWIWMLVDCLKNEDSKENDIILWVLVIILTNWIGALIYFFVRRPERKRKQFQKFDPA